MNQPILAKKKKMNQPILVNSLKKTSPATQQQTRESKKWEMIKGGNPFFDEQLFSISGQCVFLKIQIKFLTQPEKTMQNYIFCQNVYIDKT